MALTRSCIPPTTLHQITVVFETRRRQWSTTIWPWTKTRSCARWEWAVTERSTPWAPCISYDLWNHCITVPTVRRTTTSQILGSRWPVERETAECSINVNLFEGCFHWSLAVRWFIMTRPLGPRRRVHWTNPPCSMILVSVHQTNMDSRCCCDPAVSSLPWIFWVDFVRFPKLLNCSTSKKNTKDKASEYWNQAIRILTQATWRYTTWPRVAEDVPRCQNPRYCPNQLLGGSELVDHHWKNEPREPEQVGRWGVSLFLYEQNGSEQFKLANLSWKSQDLQIFCSVEICRCCIQEIWIYWKRAFVGWGIWWCFMALSGGHFPTRLPWIRCLSHECQRQRVSHEFSSPFWHGSLSLPHVLDMCIYDCNLLVTLTLQL